MLLMLERMHFIDMVHALAKGTHKQYQQKLALVQHFGDWFEVPVLMPTLLECPLGGPGIYLMWIQEHYALQLTSWCCHYETDEQTTVQYLMVCGVQSAASMFYKLDMQLAYLGQAYLDPTHCILLAAVCSPMDELSTTLAHSGMSHHLGDEA